MPNHTSFQSNTDIQIRRLGIADADRFKAMRVDAATESPPSVKPTSEEELEKSMDDFEKKLG